MALNKFMHPRNIYKVPPDFGKLATKYTEFSKIAKVDITGKVNIDFKDPSSLRVLTKCLLKSDFGIDIDIPEDRLVPTLPLRLNYILWLEDLMMIINRNNNVKGVDIGTGACAIYPLIAAVKNKWHMIGTETDLSSLQKALCNINQNNLQEYITLAHNKTSSIIDFIFTENGVNEIFDFCMCNPPFYSNMQELYESRSPARGPPKNGFTGSPQELITEGGELQFCRELIQESKNHKNDILIFTTMLGHKYTLQELLLDLKSEGIKYTHTEFCQGRVTRWGLAWTFKEYEINKLAPPREVQRKKKVPILYTLPKLTENHINIEYAFDKIKTLLNKLNINFRILEKVNNNILLDIVATENTWSKQRLKRRLEKRQESIKEKRPKLESTESTHELKNYEPSINNEDGKDKLTENIIKYQPVVHSFLKLHRKGLDIIMELEFLDGSAGKEGLHQIMQYVKNNWK